ncbi:MAG: acetate--CoA ligase family protein [Candidatus Eisenbacteria bacterium]
MDETRIRQILDRSIQEGRRFLLESEGFELLSAMGIETPRRAFLPLGPNGEVDENVGVGLASGTLNLDEAFADRAVVLKVVSRDIQHKSDVGGVAFLDRASEGGAHQADVSPGGTCEAGAHGVGDAIHAALITRSNEMLATVRSHVPSAVLDGVLVAERIDYPKSLGHELLVGLRWTPDVGPIAVFGVGGIYTEFLSGAFRDGRDIAVLSPHLDAPVLAAAKNLAVTSLLTDGLRSQQPLARKDRIAELLAPFLELARKFMPDRIEEMEVNPFVVVPQSNPDGSTSAGTTRGVATGGSADDSARFVALDVLVRLATTSPTAAEQPTDLHRSAQAALPRPLRKIDALLHPKSIAIAGVSESHENPGRVILDNLLAGGFDKSRVYVLKAGMEELVGVRCVGRPSDLPERVDMAVLSVAAATLPGMVTEFIEAERAESLIVIPGGLEEKEGSEAIVGQMRDALRKSRETEWGGPVINGGNCLGIQSRPGNYDTLFIPRYKLPVPQGEPAKLALICQSGAHMVANLDRLGGIAPRYAISAGNQTDLTVGDYLTHLADDPEIELFACYVEGFRPLDGIAFMKAAERITRSGRTVLLYLASRTPSGAKASASHTASLAGDYAVLRQIATQAGIVLAKNLANFADLVQLFVHLGGKTVTGLRLGAISNAGFECVAMADAVRRAELATFSAETTATLAAALDDARLGSIVDVHNPLDLTPISNDAIYDRAVSAVLADDGVDLGVVESCR